MRSIEKQIVTERFTKNNKVHCGFCGDPIGEKIYFIELKPPEKLEDIVTCCDECKKDVTHHNIEQFRNELQDIKHNLYFVSHRKYTRAIKFGLNPLPEKIVVKFYYENISPIVAPNDERSVATGAQ